MVAFDDDGRRSIILESKFGAGLTSNQPHAYLSLTDGVVVVVCPPRRNEPLWPELLRRCEHLGARADSSLAGATRKATTADGKVLALTTWDSLISHIRAAVQVEDPAMLGDVDQLASMCAVFAADAFTPFASEELTADTGRRIEHLNALIDDLATHAVSHPDVNRQGLRSSGGSGYYGQGLNLPGSWYAYLVFSAYMWSRYAATPLWLQLKNAGEHNPALVESVLAPLWGSRNQPVFAREWRIPLHPPTGVDRDAVLRSLKGQLDSVIALVRNAQHDQETV